MGQMEEIINNDSLHIVLDSLRNTAKVCVSSDTVEVISQSQRHGLECHSALVFVAFLLFIMVLVSLYGLASKRVKKCIWNLVHKCLHVIFLITWISGFCLYCVGMHVPVDNSILAVAPMAIIHATEMFVGMSDISAVHADCINSAAYMIWFGFSHLLAVIVSMLFLFRQFGHHISSWIRLRWTSIFSKPKHLYVFWGQNERSYLLARDILKNEVAGERLVMIRTFDDQHNSESKMSFSKQFEMMKMNNSSTSSARMSMLGSLFIVCFQVVQVDNVQLKGFYGKPSGIHASTFSFGEEFVYQFYLSLFQAFSSERHTLE